MLQGYSSHDATFLISIIGILNTFGEVIVGWLGDQVIYTGGPRYSRTFYLRFRLFTVQENTYQNSVFAVFSSLIRVFLKEFALKMVLKWLFQAYSAPSLFAVSVFAVLWWNVSTANYEGSLYNQSLRDLRQFLTVHTQWLWPSYACSLCWLWG